MILVYDIKHISFFLSLSLSHTVTHTHTHTRARARARARTHMYTHAERERDKKILVTESITILIQKTFIINTLIYLN